MTPKTHHFIYRSQSLNMFSLYSFVFTIHCPTGYLGKLWTRSFQKVILQALGRASLLWLMYACSKLLIQPIMVYICTRKGAQVVTNLQQTSVATLFQQIVNRMCSHCLFPAGFQQLVDNLVQDCWAQQTCYKLFQQLCYRPAIQQFVNKLLVTTLQQLDKITALSQLVDKLATSLLRTQGNLLSNWAWESKFWQ
jgi:hypothetical protein